MTKQTIKISLDISQDLKEKLQQLAKEKEMSISGLVRLILKMYFAEK